MPPRHASAKSTEWFFVAEQRINDGRTPFGFNAWVGDQPQENIGDVPASFLIVTFQGVNHFGQDEAVQFPR